MKSFVVLYATREGQTRRIATHIAEALRTLGARVDMTDVGGGLPELDLEAYTGAVVAAPIHIGKHEKAMVDFVKAHRAALERLPTSFLSVSLSQAGVEDPNRRPDKKERSAAEVKKTIDLFLRTTGWHPAHIHPVAGALLYRQYHPVIRLVMRIIAKMTGGSTDTSRDHEYTDWKAIASFANELAADAARS